MLFPTLDYALFLPLVVAIYWLVRSMRLGGQLILLVASLLFYGLWNPVELPILLLIIGLTWASTRLISRLAPDRRKAAMAVTVVLLFIPLFFFKYSHFFSENIMAMVGLSGLIVEIPRHGLPLPIGLSFFTFQAVAYVVDVARGEEPEPSLKRTALFISFFPQLVAGPIVRGWQLLPQLRKEGLLSQGDIAQGLYLIGRGMIKKVCFADILRLGMVDSVFLSPHEFTTFEVLVALYAYTLQIYCDFSGYTDIALVSARLFGIKLPDNFNRPYKATSVAGYWRRWHMTLSMWLREYVYFPLGGSRGAPLFVYRNILITMILIGLWHGAGWAFVLYGLIHGIAVCINRYQRQKTGRLPDDPLPSWWAWAWRFALTFNFVVLARILFRSADLSLAWDVTRALENFDWIMPRYSVHAWIILVLGYAVHFSPNGWEEKARAWIVGRSVVVQVLFVVAVVLACVFLGPGESLSFIYYDF